MSKYEKELQQNSKEMRYALTYQIKYFDYIEYSDFLYGFVTAMIALLLKLNILFFLSLVLFFFVINPYFKNNFERGFLLHKFLSLSGVETKHSINVKKGKKFI